MLDGIMPLGRQCNDVFLSSDSYDQQTLRPPLLHTLAHPADWPAATMQGQTVSYPQQLSPVTANSQQTSSLGQTMRIRETFSHQELVHPPRGCPSLRVAWAHDHTARMEYLFCPQGHMF